MSAYLEAALQTEAQMTEQPKLPQGWNMQVASDGSSVTIINPQGQMVTVFENKARGESV
jgi:hypothetical protein